MQQKKGNIRLEPEQPEHRHSSRAEAIETEQLHLRKATETQSEISDPGQPQSK